MPGLRFVNAGEALEHYSRERERGDELNWRHSQRQRALRDDRQKQGIDAALRGAVSQSSVLSDMEASHPALTLTHHDDGTALDSQQVVTPERRPSWRAPVIRQLAGTQGGGAQAAEMLAQEERSRATERTATRNEQREERQLVHQGIEAFNKAMDNGDLETARVINRRFRLGIPEQTFTNQKALALVRGISSTLHRSGVRGDVAAEAFLAALENPDLPMDQIIRKGMGAGAGRADRGDLIETSKGWYNLRTKTYVQGPDNDVLMPTDRRLSHPPRAPSRTGVGGSGPRVHKVQELANGTIRLIMSDSSSRILTDSLGSPERGPAAARRAASLVGKMVSPIQTREERSAAVREGVRISDEIGGVKPPATRLRFDAQGNQVPDAAN